VSSEFLRQTITFQLNQASGVPAYLQIVQQVEQALRMGTLRPGDQLPTVKQVVAEVTVNPNTVTKAYRELEHAGLAEGRQGVGTFVLRRPQGPPPEEQMRLARGLERWVETARAASAHRVLVGPRRSTAELERLFTVVKATQTERQSRVLARLDGPVPDPAWEVSEVGLEDIILAYMSHDEALTAGPLSMAGGTA
jgi:GntR family transcriptional regulator